MENTPKRSTADVEEMRKKRLEIYKKHLANAQTNIDSFYDTSAKQSQSQKVLTAEDFKPKHDDSVDALVYGLQEYYKKSGISSEKDMVNHPPHYKVGGFEVIDIIQAFTQDLNGIAAVDTGNAIKYILRWHNKNGIEDLKKAKWYIEHLIKKLEEWENDSDKR